MSGRSRVLGRGQGVRRVGDELVLWLVSLGTCIGYDILENSNSNSELNFFVADQQNDENSGKYPRFKGNSNDGIMGSWQACHTYSSGTVCMVRVYITRKGDEKKMHVEH